MKHYYSTTVVEKFKMAVDTGTVPTGMLLQHENVIHEGQSLRTVWTGD